MGVALVSPLLGDHSRQARAGAGFDRAGFHIDFDTRQAAARRAGPAPGGTRSPNAAPGHCDQVRGATCRPCPVRDQCTRSTSPKIGRQLTVPPREIHQAQCVARAARATPDWQAHYAPRAGVEGTIRQAVAVTGTRRARYRGLAKTRLEHVFSAVALNLIRLHSYWHGHPLDRTRTSHLARLELALAG